MGLRAILGMTVLAVGLMAGPGAQAEVRPDRPDGGAPPLLQSGASKEPAPAADSRPGTPAPRALDSTRSPMPDREALPKDVQDARLAPPTPPVPQSSGTKTGGGPARVKEIFAKPPAAGAPDPRRTP